MTTRMQQRRGTAAEWTATNSGNGPVLAIGEIGFETDTNKFKIGNGTSNWISLPYFTDAASITNAINSVIDGAPAALDTLNELAAALGDDANFLANLATQTYVDTAVSGVTTDITQAAGYGLDWNTTTEQFDVDSTTIATKNYVDNVISTHPPLTTNVHGIADTAELATKTYANTAVSNHASDTTNVHGIADTAALALTAEVNSLLELKAPLASPTFTGTVTLPTGTVTSGIIADGTIVNADINASAAIDKSKISGTAITAADTGTVTSTMLADATIVDGDISATAAIAQSKISGLTTDLAAKAPLESPTFTGTVTLPANTISQSMMGDDSVGTNEIGGLAVTTGKIADGAVTSLKIANDTIVDADINSAAAIAQSKISGLTTDLAAKLALAGGTMTGALTLSGAPTSDLHAATKLYVDNVTAGINFHQAVHVATTANLSADYSNGTDGIGATLTASTNAAWPTIDGHSSFTQYDRILVKNQTDAKQNGIYILSDLGSAGSKWILTRATDADNNPTGEMKTGDFVLALNGGQAGYGFVNNSTANPIAIGTDNITYTEFNAAKTIVAGNGLQEATPGTLSIDTAITATVANLDLKAPIASPTFTGTVTLPAEGIVFSDGTQSKEGVASRTPIIQKTAAYTLSVLTERDSLIEVSSATGVTVSIPTDATLNYPIGTSIDILQTGAGQVTIAAVTPGTTTVNATPGLKLRAQWSSCTLFKRAANTWIVMGDLSA